MRDPADFVAAALAGLAANATRSAESPDAIADRAVALGLATARRYAEATRAPDVATVKPTPMPEPSGARSRRAS